MRGYSLPVQLKYIAEVLYLKLMIMDHEKLNSLTHYVTFVQTNLVVNSEMLQLLLEGRVLSAEEISLIDVRK